MTKKANTMKRGIALLVGCLVGIPAVSQAAQERKSPLADAPAIRKRLELRDKRFELGVGLMQTLEQDFYNALMLNIRLGFHITDWLGVSVSAGVYNLTPDWRTSFNNRLNAVLPTDSTDKTPTQANAAAAENRIGQVILPQIDFVPVTGKLAMFGRLFMNYDFYVVAGPGFVNLVKKGTVTDNSKPETGMKLAGNVGVGLHAFANNYFAINIELHDLIYKNNAAGRDVTGSSAVDSHDLQWTNNFMVGLNFTFFLPAEVKVSH